MPNERCRLRGDRPRPTLPSLDWTGLSQQPPDQTPHPSAALLPDASSPQTTLHPYPTLRPRRCPTNASHPHSHLGSRPTNRTTPGTAHPDKGWGFQPAEPSPLQGLGLSAFHIVQDPASDQGELRCGALPLPPGSSHGRRSGHPLASSVFGAIQSGIGLECGELRSAIEA